MRSQYDALRFQMALKLWRKLHGMSMHDVFELTGIPIANISRIETDSRCPTMAEFGHLCELMEFDAQEFFVKPERLKNG